MALGRICRQGGGRICTTCKTGCRLDNARRNAKSKAHGLTKARWKQGLRKRALERDRYRCRLRLSGCTGKASTVHLRPELAGDHDAANLDDVLSCCAHCHGVIDGRRAS
jgi:ribosomal protein L28